MRILTEHATGIINFEKKKNMFLTNEHQKPYENAQVCHVCNENLKINMLNITNIVNLETIVIILGIIEVLRIAYVI